MLSCYTDGSCLGNPGRGGWGFIVLKDDVEIYRYGAHAPRSTNNIMELTAMFETLKYVEEHHAGVKAVVYTDSTYVRQGMTQWIKSWKRNGFVTSNGKDVKNRELWEAIDGVFNRLANDVRIEWVRAHNGNPWNEAVDTYARSFANDVSITSYLR